MCYQFIFLCSMFLWESSISEIVKYHLYTFLMTASGCRRWWNFVWGKMASWFGSSTEFKFCNSSYWLQTSIYLGVSNALMNSMKSSKSEFFGDAVVGHESIMHPFPLFIYYHYYCIFKAMEYLLKCREQGGQCSAQDFYTFLSEFQKASR